MNGFHVYAVGWVLTFNARALSPEEGQELCTLWTALVRARAEDEDRAPLLFRLLQSRSIRLSAHSTVAFAELVERMVALHPERFGEDALRGRCRHWALQAALSLVLGFLAATWLPRGSPLTSEAVLALFTMGCGFLVPTATLWRAARAVKTLRAQAGEIANPAHGVMRG